MLISAVAGTAGVGKTALAVRWAHRIKDRFPDGQLYVDLRGYGPDQPAAPDDTLAAFLRALGVEGTVIPQELTERAALFRTLVDQKRLLIVLDNAHSPEHVRPLLPGTPTCFVVVTSRDSLAGLAAREGAQRINLDRLTTDEAHRLLTELLGNHSDADSAAMSQLIELCAHLPLALRITAERIRERPRRQLADLVTELADEQARLDLLDTGDPHSSVRAVFSSSYRHLEPDTARLFRLLGLHPGHDIDAHALTALAGSDDLRATQRRLGTLVRANLVDETADHHFQLHDLLWAYAAELSETTDTAADRRAALARLFDYYLHTASVAASFIAPHERDLPAQAVSRVAVPAFASYEAAVRWLDTERANLIRAAETAAAWNLPTYPTDFFLVLSWYLDLGWYLDDSRRLHTTALAVARERGDSVAEGLAIRGRGMVSFRLDRFADAARDFEDSLALHEAAGERTLQALTLNCLGALCGLVGPAEDAIRHLQRSADIYAELGHRWLSQRPLVNLGLLYRRRGQYEQAFTCLREAFAIAEEGNHPPFLAHAAYGLAGLYRDTQRYDEALDCARRALTFARKARFQFLECLALNRLGTVYLRLGDLDTALQHHHEALKIARATSNTRLEAMALNGSAEAHAAAGAPAEAIRCHTDALVAAASQGANYEQARAHAGLGDAHDQLGERDKAIEHWQQALTSYRDLQAPKAAEMQAKLARY